MLLSRLGGSTPITAAELPSPTVSVSLWTTAAFHLATPSMQACACQFRSITKKVLEKFEPLVNRFLVNGKETPQQGAASPQQINHPNV